MLKMGIVGCAGIARHRMMPAMRAHPAFTVSAVASRSLDRAQQLADEYSEDGCRAIDGYHALVEDPDIDAVYVPLPAALHAEWVEAALRAGKHVLAEKPLTTSPETSRALFELAQARGLVLLENVMFVHHAQHREVLRLVAEGAIGTPHFFEAAFTIPRQRDEDIRYRAALGGGCLFDVGIYPTRAAVHLLGGPFTVVGAVLETPAGREVDTSGSALLRSADGVSVHLSFGMDDHYRSSYALSGSEGRILVDRAFTPPADHVPEVFLDAGGTRRRIALPADDQVAATLAAFAAGTVDRAACLAGADLVAAIRAAA